MSKLLSSAPSSTRHHHQIEPQSDHSFDRSTTAAAIVPIKTKLRPTSPAFYPAGFAHKDDVHADDAHDKSDKPMLAPIADDGTTAADAAVLGQAMTGIVHNLKHAYGFVKCEATGERIFFHYSDIDPNTAKAFGPVAPDLPPVIIGDEVRFRKVVDEPTGKQKAVKVEVVRRPSRNVSVEPKPELQHQESAESHGTAAADDYKSVHDPDAARETGVVVSAKQNYGFIKCAEREHKQVFFHFSEVVGVHDPPAQVQPGLEVLFSLSSTASGRVVATRIQMLPPGTISFYTIESSVLYGFIDKNLESSHTSSQKTRRRARPSSNDSGTLVLPAKERARLESVTALPYAQDTVMSFTGVDLKFPGIRLAHGDQVGFRLKLDRRTQAYSATDIFLIRCAPAGRKRGIVTIWKDLYGFLKMDGAPEQMFVHQNEFIEKSHKPAVGDELEFNLAPDNHGQDNAIRISILPRGTVQLFDDRVFGVVTENPSLIYPAMPEPLRRALTADQRPSPTTSLSARFAETTPLYGAIRLLHDQCQPTQRGVKLRYRSADAADPQGMVRFATADLDPNAAVVVRVGDIVSLTLAPAPKFQRCANVQLLPKQGVISAVANNQIVIKVESNDISAPELFEFLCDDGADADLQVGEKVEIDQIEAGIAPMSMRIARRLRTLKPHKHGGAGQHVGRNHKPTLKKSVSMDLSPSSYRRWDLRLEPRNWS